MSVVFESPDNGKTIYQREKGSNERELVRRNDADGLLDKWLVWQDILLESRTNEALAEALDRAKIIYEITRKHDNN